MTRLLFGFAALLLSNAAIAETIVSSFSAQVEEDEIDAFNGAVDQAFFNVQGDDDAFTVYSFADFDGAAFGFAPLAPGDITDISLGLTQSNAGFTADGGLEFFLASDTRAVDVDDTARYNSGQGTGTPNSGADVVGSDFGTLYSLGTSAFVQTNTGDLDTIALTLDTAGEAFLVTQLNSGGIVRIIGTPGDTDVQATYSGATSLLTPPGPPSLTINAVTAVPEPTSLAALGLVAAGAVARRRRKSRVNATA